MKNLLKLKLTGLLLSILFLSSCVNEDDNHANQEKKGLVTSPGFPIGEDITKKIGSEGGTISTADERIHIEIPAGAFESEETVSIIPISNTNPAGLGSAFRILPHGKVFSKPVKLTFLYQDEELSRTIAEAFQIAYQNDEGIWKAVGGALVDINRKTVTIETNHFSDWSFFSSISIEPWSASLKLNESIELKVYRSLELDDPNFPVPIITKGKEQPLIGKEELDASAIEKWELGGQGTLTANGNKATYNAPSTIPTVNPVAISAKLKSTGAALKLVTNIFIGEEGITYRIDDGEWVNASVPFAGPIGEITLINGGPVVDHKPIGSISVSWTGTTGDIVKPWSLEDFPKFQASLENYNYYNFDAKPGNVILSKGALHVTEYGEIGGYIAGFFLVEDAGKQLINNFDNPFVKPVRIEGFFRVKRTL